jgi:hypothetical protein
MARQLAALAMLVTGLTAAAAPNLKEKGEPLYYATKEGDKPVYEMRSGDTTTEATEVVTKVEKKDGTLLISVSREFQGRTTPPSQVSVSEKGVFRVASAGRELPVPIPMLKLPGKPGDTWTYEPDTGGGGGPARKTTYRMGREEEVEVPAGKFKALRVESEQELGANLFRSTLWYAPGVGLVKSLTNTNGHERIQVLKSFTPGK